MSDRTLRATAAGGDPPPVLLMALLGVGPERLVGRTGVLEPVEAQLAVIRSSGSVLEWFGVNERRVDAVVSAGDDQYRIVYFTTDGVTVDSLSVFRRPPLFDGVPGGGRVVVVNGPSGAGKSSVLTALTSHCSLPWVVFDEPVIGQVEQGYLIWRDQAPMLHRGFLDAIATLARRGNLVGLSAAGHEPKVIDEAFEGVEVLRVGLDCNAVTLLERERGREGRWGGLVAASLADHEGWRYDLRFDTSCRSPSEIASEVLRVLGLQG